MKNGESESNHNNGSSPEAASPTSEAASPTVPEVIGVRRDFLTRFKPGVVANPKGRPKGSRNKLAEFVLEAMANDFKKHGKAVIEKVRAERPADYLKVAAALLPRQQEIEVGPPSELKASDLTDDQLATFIAQHIDAEIQSVPALPNPRVKAGC
jgi:hypothetical protein